MCEIVTGVLIKNYQNVEKEYSSRRRPNLVPDFLSIITHLSRFDITCKHNPQLTTLLFKDLFILFKMQFSVAIFALLSALVAAVDDIPSTSTVCESGLLNSCAKSVDGKSRCLVLYVFPPLGGPSEGPHTIDAALAEFANILSPETGAAFRFALQSARTANGARTAARRSSLPTASAPTGRSSFLSQSVDIDQGQVANDSPYMTLQRQPLHLHQQRPQRCSQLRI